MKLKLVTLILITSVAGCKGGAGNSDSGVTVTPVQIVQTASPVQTSVQLIDNPVAHDAQFSQYRDHDLSIDLALYPMAGNTIFVKFYLNPDKTLYLGKIRDNQVFSVNLPATSKVVYFDLFSETVSRVFVMFSFSILFFLYCYILLCGQQRLEPEF